MAILKSRSKVIAAKIESVFNVAESLSSTDTLEVQSSTSINTTMDTVARDVIKDSLLSTPDIPVRENTSGEISVELMNSGTGDDILGDALLEAGVGVKSVAGAAGAGTGAFIGFSDDGTTVADEIYMATASDTNASTAVAYTLASPNSDTKSLTVKEFVGTNKSVTTTGNVVSAVKITLPTADVASISFSVEGCGFSTNEADTKLATNCITSLPYIGKSATFKFDGNSLSATDVSIDITNTIFNEEAVTADGYTSKVITAQEVKGTFTALFTDYSMLTKFQSNASGSLYIVLTQGTSKFAVYIPELKITSFSKTDNSGVLSQTIEFKVPYSCDGSVATPIVIASEVA